MSTSDGILHGFERIDRRWIYLTLLVAVIAAILVGPIFPDRPGVMVDPIFNAIEELPPGTPVMLSLDYSPSSAPELEPMAEALVRHLLIRDLPICFMSLWPTGNNMAERLEHGVIAAEFPAAAAGREWATLGFQAGGELLIHSLTDDLGSRYATDVRGVALGELEALENVHNLADFGLVISLSAGTPGLKEWILYGGDVADVRLAGGCTGVGAPQFFPYYPRQLMGLMAALKGAAEYEAALHAHYPSRVPTVMRATQGMGPQAVAHVVIVVFVVLGNLGYLLRRKGRGENR